MIFFKWVATDGNERTNVFKNIPLDQFQTGKSSQWSNFRTAHFSSSKYEVPEKYLWLRSGVLREM